MSNSIRDMIESRRHVGVNTSAESFRRYEEAIAKSYAQPAPVDYGMGGEELLNAARSIYKAVSRFQKRDGAIAKYLSADEIARQHKQLEDFYMKNPESRPKPDSAKEKELRIRQKEAKERDRNLAAKVKDWEQSVEDHKSSMGNDPRSQAWQAFYGDLVDEFNKWKEAKNTQAKKQQAAELMAEMDRIKAGNDRVFLHRGHGDMGRFIGGGGAIEPLSEKLNPLGRAWAMPRGPLYGTDAATDGEPGPSAISDRAEAYDDEDYDDSKGFYFKLHPDARILRLDTPEDLNAIDNSYLTPGYTANSLWNRAVQNGIDPKEWFAKMGDLEKEFADLSDLNAFLLDFAKENGQYSEEEGGWYQNPDNPEEVYPLKYWIDDNRSKLSDLGSKLKLMTKVIGNPGEVYAGKYAPADIVQGLSGPNFELDYTKLGKDYDAVEFTPKFAEQARRTFGREGPHSIMFPPITRGQFMVLNPGAAEYVGPYQATPKGKGTPAQPEPGFVMSDALKERYRNLLANEPKKSKEPYEPPKPKKPHAASFDRPIPNHDDGRPEYNTHPEFWSPSPYPEDHSPEREKLNQVESAAADTGKIKTVNGIKDYKAKLDKQSDNKKDTGKVDKSMSEPDFKSMMKSARTNGTGISNESFRKAAETVIHNKGMAPQAQTNLIDWAEYGDARKQFDGVRDEIPGDGAEMDAAYQKEQAAKKELTNTDGAEHKEPVPKKKKPKTSPYNDPKKYRTVKSDPLLEAIHQMRYGQTFVKTGNPQVNDARARMANGKDDEAFEDAASDDEQY